MLRVDKLTLAILEENVKSILLKDFDSIPTLKMLFKSTQQLEENALKIKKKISSFCKCELIETKTVIGGGTTPNKKIPSIALSIEFKNYKPNKIEKLFRAKNIIGRIESEKFLLDFRTILEDDINTLIEKIGQIINE